MLSKVREIIKYEIDNVPKNEIAYLEKQIDTLTSEVYFLREELKKINLLIKSTLIKSESVNRDQHICVTVNLFSQNENINKTVTTSVPKVDLTAIRNQAPSKKINPTKTKNIYRMFRIHPTKIKIHLLRRLLGLVNRR